MNVYVVSVSTGEFDTETHVDCVFATEDAAKSYISKFNAENKYSKADYEECCVIGSKTTE